jgi:hypothetical protein
MKMTLLCGIVMAGVMLMPVPSLAQDPVPPPSPATDAASSETPIAPAARTLAQWVRLDPPAPRRPAILPALYASYGALQALDAYTTVQATRRGGVELNPALRPVAGNFSALIAVKTGLAAATVLCTERLWKQHRTAAIVTMIAANGIVAAAAAHNARQHRSPHR